MNSNQYPIGSFKKADSYSDKDLENFLIILRELPEQLENLVADISSQQLNTAYREGGWTAQQVIHHMADSHLNLLVRLKWTITEDLPKIKAYHEDRWATLTDYSLPISVSVNMLKAIHAKVVILFESLDEEGLNRKYFHPESEQYWDLKTVMALYAWHSEHHLAHIKICKNEWQF